MKLKLTIAIVVSTLLSMLSVLFILLLIGITRQSLMHFILLGYPWVYGLVIAVIGLLPALIGLVIVWIVLRRAVFKPLECLRDTIKRQEREAFFGKLAAGLVHDLRHPIQSLQNCGPNLERAAEDPDLRKVLQKNFVREFEKINHFLKDLEDLSTGIPHLPICLNLRTLIEETVESFREDAGSKQIKIDTACDPIEIRGDRFALIRLFSNLTDNALQAMPNGGLLRIHAVVEKEFVRVDSEDSGVGIPKERLDKIFEEFWTSKERGLGLGLAICKKIIDQHGGKIEVTSETGKGTCFAVYLPLIS